MELPTSSGSAFGVLALAVALLLGACAHAPRSVGAASPVEAQETTAVEAQEPTASSDVPGGRELADILAASSAVVVATARVVDDRAGLTKASHEGGTTRVVLAVEQVLFGAAIAGERELWLRGGVLPDGTILGYSEGPPDLTEGDRYILFLRDAPQGADPFVRSRHAVLRIARFGDQERVVDDGGHGIVADPRGGLRSLGKISEAMLERSIARERAEGSDAVYVSQDRIVPADIERASVLRDVLAAIVEVATRARAE